GRGLGFAVAAEAALKLKETCALQAEAFSGAEIRHGPMALIDEGYPVLIFALRGPEQRGLIELATFFRQRNARVVLAAPNDVPDRDEPEVVRLDVVEDARERGDGLRVHAVHEHDPPLGAGRADRLHRAGEVAVDAVGVLPRLAGGALPIVGLDVPADVDGVL